MTEKPTSTYGAKAFLREVFARKLPHKFGGSSVHEFRINRSVCRETERETNGNQSIN